VDNPETLRHYYELLNASGDPPLALIHPEIEIHMFEGSPISGPYFGHDGVRDWQRDTFDVIDSWGLELDEVIEGEDPDVMVAMQRFVGRMKHTDLPVNFPLPAVVRFRDGLVVGFHGYRSREEAMAAAGLGKKPG